MKIHQVPAADLVPADLILLDAGGNLPADCRLVEAFSLRVNNAIITGESLPASRDAGPCDEAEPMYSRNTLLAGTSIVSGTARALVFATGSQSAFGRIARVSHIVAGPRHRTRAELLLIGRAIGLTFWETSSSPSASSWRTCRKGCCRP